MLKLKFGKGNAKLNETIATFSLPSGWTCPCANVCLSKADRITGKITDGPENQFRCFSASQEAVYPNVRLQRWNNLEALKEAKTVQRMANLICDCLPVGISKVRVHVAGDFFSADYFKAWIEVAKRNSHLIFYGYTKRADLLVKFQSELPSNFRFVASLGGTKDTLAVAAGLKTARVVFTEAEAKRLGLELDHADDHAYSTDKKSFALLLHGTQPAGSPAADAWKVIKKAGKGYNEARRKATGLGTTK